MNNSAWELEERHTILELWTNALTKSPETIFVHFLEGDKKYTYAQFVQLTNQLAHGLLAVATNLIGATWRSMRTTLAPIAPKLIELTTADRYHACLAHPRT